MQTRDQASIIGVIPGCALLVLVMSGNPQAFAQVDLVGDWMHPPLGQNLAFHEDRLDRADGPETGDFPALPLNDAGIALAESWTASWLAVPERQCTPHPATYQIWGVGTLTIHKEYDPTTRNLLAYHLDGTYGLDRTIWMDGRPHPPSEAPHTYNGFSTGRYEGDTLVVETTHLRGNWLRRNGTHLSDRTTMIEYFNRHDDYITYAQIVNDPIYLSEPFVRTTEYVLDPRPPARLGGTVSWTRDPVFYKCFPAEELGTDRHRVPHFLPGTNPFPDEWADLYGVPRWVMRVGAPTMYPEFMEQMNERAPSLARPANQSREPGRVEQDGDASDREVRSLHVKGRVWMVSGGGANVTVQVGEEGVLLVDTGRGEMAESILTEVRKIAGGKPIRYVINTTWDLEHTGGNEVLGEGATDPIPQRASLSAHENAAFRLTELGRRGNAIPRDTFYGESKHIRFNDEPIDIIHLPVAHSDGEVMVHFRGSDVLSVGDVITTLSYPVIKPEEGGSLTGVIDALNRIIDITVADWRQQGGTYVIPGHGRIYDETDVVDYRDMLVMIRDRIVDHIEKGKTLEELKSGNLTIDFDPRYGPNAGPWTSDMFLEASYRSLTTGRADD